MLATFMGSFPKPLLAAPVRDIVALVELAVWLFSDMVFVACYPQIWFSWGSKLRDAIGWGWIRWWIKGVCFGLLGGRLVGASEDMSICQVFVRDTQNTDVSCVVRGGCLNAFCLIVMPGIADHEDPPRAVLGIKTRDVVPRKARLKCRDQELLREQLILYLRLCTLKVGNQKLCTYLSMIYPRATVYECPTIAFGT